MTTLHDILNQELMLFRAALENERRKRRAILTADGKRLKELTGKSEIFLKEVEGLEVQREAALRLLLDRYGENDRSEGMTLRKVVRLVTDHEANAQANLELESVADEYRETAYALKRETEENNRLLSDTTGRIHYLLTELTEDPERDKTYAPKSGRKQEADDRQKALLLNVNG